MRSEAKPIPAGKPRSRRRVWLFRAMAMSLPLALGFMVAEIYFRLHDLRKSSVYEQSSNRIDTELGWAPKENFSSQGESADSVGQKRPYRFSTGKAGFRLWPESGGGRPKILIVGDSFTQAERIDDSRTYCARLGEMLQADIYAFGCSGYGTLQEWLVIDRHIDEIRPDVIVLQVCSNDFVNSSVVLENASRRHNNGLSRPYPQPDGSVAWDVPRKLKALSWLSVNSRFLFWLVKRIDQSRAGFDVPDGTYSVTRPILPGDALAPELQRTETAMAAVLERLKQRAGANCRVVLFAVDQDEPYHTLWKKFAGDLGFTFAGDFDAVLHAQEKQAGKPIGRIDDHHWNEFGHERAAEYLRDRLKNLIGESKPTD